MVFCYAECVVNSFKFYVVGMQNMNDCIAETYIQATQCVELVLLLIHQVVVGLLLKFKVSSMRSTAVRSTYLTHSDF